MNNNASAFLQYVQTIQNPATQDVLADGVIHDLWDCSDQLADIVWVVN